MSINYLLTTNLHNKRQKIRLASESVTKSMTSEIFHTEIENNQSNRLLKVRAGECSALDSDQTLFTHVEHVVLPILPRITVTPRYNAPQTLNAHFTKSEISSQLNQDYLQCNQDNRTKIALSIDVVVETAIDIQNINNNSCACSLENLCNIAKFDSYMQNKVKDDLKITRHNVGYIVTILSEIGENNTWFSIYMNILSNANKLNLCKRRLFWLTVVICHIISNDKKNSNVCKIKVLLPNKAIQLKILNTVMPLFQTSTFLPTELIALASLRNLLENYSINNYLELDWMAAVFDARNNHGDNAWSIALIIKTISLLQQKIPLSLPIIRTYTALADGNGLSEECQDILMSHPDYHALHVKACQFRQKKNLHKSLSIFIIRPYELLFQLHPSSHPSPMRERKENSMYSTLEKIIKHVTCEHNKIMEEMEDDAIQALIKLNLPTNNQSTENKT